MLKTVLIIVLSVSIFGILFFIYVKKMLEKKLNYYLREKRKNKKII